MPCRRHRLIACWTTRTSCPVRSATRVRRQNRARKPHSRVEMVADSISTPGNGRSSKISEMRDAGCQGDRIDDDEGCGLWEVDVVEEGWWPALLPGVVQMLIGAVPRGRKYGECPVSALIQLTASGGMSGEGVWTGLACGYKPMMGWDTGWMDVAPIFFPFLFTCCHVLDVSSHLAVTGASHELSVLNHGCLFFLGTRHGRTSPNGIMTYSPDSRESR
ncbi:hypothetical protein F5X68DRAFT_18318 [Plectosphaerella plurivora]|uniref:Uncharacterized protein n=1 Tax=Plectosphaerella plurivora TaxID=936078 RepID=A0A9P8V8R7_9PEZI|nr:hypothetical protein F5X68DRAFT_18318 [Plectosphaerella plurivora]